MKTLKKLGLTLFASLSISVLIGCDDLEKLKETKKCEDCNLSEVNLAGEKLFGVYLMGANLSKSDLRETNLSKANLEGANLEGANLEGANLKGANLKGTNLIEANLKDVILEESEFEPLKMTLFAERTYLDVDEWEFELSQREKFNPKRAIDWKLTGDTLNYDVYSGEVNDGVPHGEGKFIRKISKENEYFVNYVGEFKNGKYEGNANLNINDSNGKFTVKSNFQEGRIHGYCIIRGEEKEKVFEGVCVGNEKFINVDNNSEILFINAVKLRDSSVKENQLTFLSNPENWSNFRIPYEDYVIEKEISIDLCCQQIIYVGEVQNGLPNGNVVVRFGRQDTQVEGLFKDGLLQKLYKGPWDEFDQHLIANLQSIEK